jgi:hypothetical protein
MVKLRAPLGTFAITSSKLALTATAALLAVACGGGGGGSSGPTNIPGFTGACSSLAGQAQGYVIGTCDTAVGAGIVSEATFQNIATAVSETASRQYSLQIPNNLGGPAIALALGQANVIDTSGVSGAVGGIPTGFALDRSVSSSDLVSLIDVSGTLGASREVSFGLFARSKQLGEQFLSGFAGPAFGKAATPVTGLPTGTVSYTGSLVSHYIFTSSAIAPAGTIARRPISGDTSVTVNFATGAVTGTLKSFQIRTSGIAGPLIINDITFTGTLAAGSNSFTGTIPGPSGPSGGGIVKGTLYGPTGLQMAGQFAGFASDGRLLTGSFGIKQP